MSLECRPNKRCEIEMEWDAIGALAETIASVGVIISLIYVGLQIRSQLIESRLESGDELTRQINHAYETLASEGDLAELFLKGLKDFQSLDGAEAMRFSAFAGSQMRLSESMFFRYENGRLAEDVWMGLNAGVRDIFRYPGMKDWWETRRHWYSERFQSYVSHFLNSEEEPRMYKGV